MKILYCITRSDTLGGAHIHVADMAVWIRAKGHDASVVVGGEGPYCDHLEAKNVPYTVSKHLVRPIHPLRDFMAINELRRIVKLHSPDLISLHSAKAGFVGRIVAHGLGKPVVFTAHGWAFTEGITGPKVRLFRALERIAAPLASRIITVSEYDRTLALQSGIGSAQNILKIYNAMPDVHAIASPGKNEESVRIIMVARLDKPKDHETLFNSLISLTNRDWMLDLVGDGPHEKKLEALAKHMGLSDRIRFLGLRKDVDNLLAQSHIFVLPTNWEGFPRSILEAMRAGLPVVASAVGGIPESVEENSTGYLIPRNGVKELRERLAYLIDHPEERHRLGNAGRQRFEEKFRFERMAEQTLAVYKELVAE